MKTQSRRKVFVALSGGVDSSVAAALLKERGFDVHGVHIKMWSDPSIPCTTKEDRRDAMRVAATLNIPFETRDFTEEYKRSVVDYMIREYADGRTPNPDVMCNKEIKFGIFLKTALQRGADFVTTGHYVRLRYSDTNTRIHTNDTNNKFVNSRAIRNWCRLFQAEDRNKDQSYFLWTLTQEQLRHCLFPIGDYTKPEVRVLARKYNLPTAEKKDSQGLCFMGKIDVREFLKTYIPEKQGLIVTTSGKKIGEHDGLAFLTLGQRCGIGIGGGTPYYVAEKDFATNTLLVAEGPHDENLFRTELTLTDINWISGKAPKLPFRCEARIRYRQPTQLCWVAQINADSNADRRRNYPRKSALPSASIRVRFEEPQRSITAGQSIVFYKNEEILGGGIIRR